MNNEKAFLQIIGKPRITTRLKRTFSRSSRDATRHILKKNSSMILLALRFKTHVLKSDWIKCHIRIGYRKYIDSLKSTMDSYNRAKRVFMDFKIL